MPKGQYQRKQRVKRITLHCEICNEEFSLTQSRLGSRFNSRFCQKCKDNKCMEVSIQEHFDRKTIPVTESGCLLWIGYRNNKGYGQINFRGKKFYAHRMAWETAHGPIPSDVCVLHKCDIPECVNTNHLFLGTKADNNSDMAKKGRANKKLTDKDVLAIRSDDRTLVVIANDYGVCISNISQIKRHETRTYVK